MQGRCRCNLIEWPDYAPIAKRGRSETLSQTGSHIAAWQHVVVAADNQFGRQTLGSLVVGWVDNN